MTTPPKPEGWYPDPDGSDGQRYWDGDSWTDLGTPATEPGASSEPAESEPTPPNGNRSLLIRYGATCGALLIVLVGLVIYAFFIKERPQVQLSPFRGDATTQTRPTGGWGPPSTPTEGTDGPLSFTVHGVEIGPTILRSDPPVKKTAAGKFVVVHITVRNAGSDAATFMTNPQKIHAGGGTYQPDDEATGYLGKTVADLAPGATQDVWIAFDVPSGTAPESIELFAEPGSPGVQVPLP
jgi:hypothetical protein